MNDKKLIIAMTTAICGAWSKGYYQGLMDGASQPDVPQVDAIIKISLEVAGITLSGDSTASAPTSK